MNLIADISHLPPSQVLTLLRAEVESRSLREYVRAVWHIHHGDNHLLWNWHIDCLCDHLEAVWPLRQIQQLLINIPPGFLKSLLVSVYWPSWLWIRDPRIQILASSANPAVALRDAKRMKDICANPWYVDRYDIDWGFDRSQDSKSFFANTEGGYRISASSGSAVIGFRGDINIGDDLLDARHASIESKQLIGHVRWYNESWRNRLNSMLHSALVVIMQRLHEIDLSGALLKEGGWEYVCLPNEYVKRTQWSVLGRYDPRENEGELLHPDFLNREKSDQIRASIGSRAYSSQYQQDPVPAAGTMVEEMWLREYPLLALPQWDPGEEQPDDYDYTVHSWDTAESSDKWAAYSVGQVWAVVGARRYLIDQIRERLLPHTLIQAIREMRERYPGARATLIEQQSTGKQVVEMLTREIPGLIPRKPDRSKEDRLLACLPQFEAGNVWIPEVGAKRWVEGYRKELLSFPASTHQDQVDATTQALNWIHEQQNAGKVFAFTL